MVEMNNTQNLSALDSLVSEGKLYTRWANSFEEITRSSFEIYDNVILDTVSSLEVGFGLQREGLLSDELEEEDEYAWEEYTDELLEKARYGDLIAQEYILRGYLYKKDIPYFVSRRIIDGEEKVGLEALGVNVVSGANLSVPTGLKYIAYLSGEIKGDNLQNDGAILNIANIVAIYDNNLEKFIPNKKKIKK